MDVPKYKYAFFAAKNIQTFFSNLSILTKIWESRKLHRPGEGA